MHAAGGERRWFWATLALSSLTIAAAVFAAWELIENRFFRHVDYLTLHYLYITRGVASSLLLSFWAGWYVLRQRRHSEDVLRRSRERYRGVLDAFPGAVALFDARRRVLEWNVGAEKLYGYAEQEVLGRPLPVVPPAKESELAVFLARAEAGEPVLDVETLRCGRGGTEIEVQLSLLPFREPGEPIQFLEIASDIRERARLRKTLLEVEKLTSMGKMAAGTAHHLNTPLAAMLLRVQMMIEREGDGPYAGDLKRLESSVNFCHQFVHRLLEFTRSVPVERQPQEVAASIESALGFLAPAIHAKSASISLDAGAGRGKRVFADRNVLEAVLLILLGNALDAIGPGGRIEVCCRESAVDRIQICIQDDGCGISREDLPHVFEPFFTTKEPGKGTGLGLAIARNAMQEHGGSIRLSSENGKGTAAYLELPLLAEAASVGRGA